MSDLSRSTLAERTVEVLNRGNRRNPDVYLVESGGARVVVKDFAPRGRWVRALLAPWLLGREMHAYRALEGLPVVPRLLGPVDELAFAVEYRPGRRMSRKLAGNVPDGFLDELGRAVDALHARGVAHLDLRHRSNVLVDEAGHPVLIDFGSAVCLRPGSWAARLLMPILSRVDRNALRKWRARLEAQGLEAQESGSGSAGASGSGRGASRPT